MTFTRVCVSCVCVCVCVWHEYSKRAPRMQQTRSATILVFVVTISVRSRAVGYVGHLLAAALYSTPRIITEDPERIPPLPYERVIRGRG